MEDVSQRLFRAIIFPIAAVSIISCGGGTNSGSDAELSAKEQRDKDIAMERYVQSLIADSNKSMLREAEEMWASRRSPEERKRDSMMKAAAGMSPERRRKYYQQYGMSPEKYVQYQFGKANALAERRKRIRAQQAAALMREQRVRWNEAREARSLSLQNARVETIKKEEEWFSGFREVEGRYPSGGETRWRRQQAEREKAFNPMSVPRTKYSPFPSEQRKN